MKIDSINNNQILWNEGLKTPNVESVPFTEMLQKAVSEVKNAQDIDAQNNLLLSTGQVSNLHQVMIDMEKADLALQFTLQVRNKIIDAYQEIMRMQI